MSPLSLGTCLESTESNQSSLYGCESQGEGVCAPESLRAEQQHTCSAGEDLLCLDQEENDLSTRVGYSSSGSLPGKEQWAGSIRGKEDRGPEAKQLGSCARFWPPKTTGYLTPGAPRAGNPFWAPCTRSYPLSPCKSPTVWPPVTPDK